MSPLYLYNNKLLLTPAGALATDPNCCCNCPQYTEYVRSGYGSNGVPTYSGNPYWRAQNGPTLSGSVWIWSSFAASNPSSFSLQHNFVVPPNVRIVSATFNYAVDNNSSLSINGIFNVNSTDSFGSPDGIRSIVPVNAILPGQVISITGLISNRFVANSDFRNNPAGVIYTLIYTYEQCQ